MIVLVIFGKNVLIIGIIRNVVCDGLKWLVIVCILVIVVGVVFKFKL